MIPVVIIETWAGKSEEVKAKLISGITRAFEEVDVKPDSLNIIIHEIPKNNWGMNGKQVSKLNPER